MDPVELGVWAGVETGGFQEGDAAFSSGEIGIESVGDVFARVDVGHGRFGGGGVRGDVDAISASGVPVSTLEQVSSCYIEKENNMTEI